MREKLTRFVLLAAVGVLAFTMVGLAQQRRPFTGIAQRALGDNSLGNDNLSTGLGFGSELPTLANSNLAPKDGELFGKITRPPSAENYLGFYAENSTAWRGLVMSTIRNNRPGVATAVWLASSSIIAEGATGDAFESTITFPDPGVDLTYRVNAQTPANTARILDTGNAPVHTVELPDREYAPARTTYPRVKTWFRTFPTYSTGAVASGIVSACSTTGGPNYLYGPAIVGYGYETDAKGDTSCTITWAAADGLGITTDGADNEGWELTQGIVDGAPGAFTIGTSPAFYAAVRFAIATVANADMIAFGFRKVEGYAALDFETYTDFYVINVDNGDFYKESSLNTTTDVDQDLAQANWTDNQVHTVEVRVSATGVATAYIQGTLESETAAFMFDDGDVVVPFFFIQTDAAGAPDVDLVFWESGIQ